MGKLLILRKNISDYFFYEIKDQDCFCNIYQTKLPFFLSRILDKKGRLFFLTRLFLASWFKNLDQYTTIVIFDTGFSTDLVKAIKKRNPKCRLILYFFNSIRYDYQKKWLSNKYIDEIWSFDRADVLRLNLKYNSTFYISVKRISTNIKYDVVFLGRNKKRMEQFESIKKKLTNESQKLWFKLIDSEMDYIPYSNYIKIVQSSRCILDITQEGQEGLSLRFMEALFYCKKLITNNKSVVTYDFYRPENIFVIGVDDYDKLNDFIHGKYVEISKKIKSRYLYENWKMRFIEDERITS